MMEDEINDFVETKINWASKRNNLFDKWYRKSNLICHVCKVVCVSPIVLVSILLYADFGPNDYRENAPHF